MAPNEAFGWTWVLVGFASGLLLGLGFHREDWLGGYASARRRMLRLGHISFLGLGFVNLLFASSSAHMRLPPASLALASWMFVLGGATMPLCCGLMAWRPATYPFFGVPVASLLLGATLAAWGTLGP
ncbi:MAG TPA: hypothetical protein VID50_05150 [Candidatus Eisenbacteria bacterium]